MKKIFNFTKIPAHIKMILMRLKSTRILMAGIIILASSCFFKANAQAGVFAGNVWALCPGDVLEISNLEATTFGINGDIWWETSGDGIFQNSILFQDAMFYVPGPIDQSLGEFTLTLYGRQFNPNGPLFYDQVTIYIADNSFLACNDHINMTFDVNCEFQVEVDMLLEGEDPPTNLYYIQIYDEDFNLVPGNILTYDYIGQLMYYEVGNSCNQNTCSGTLSVVDKLPPKLTKRKDTINCVDPILPDSIGFPLDTASIDTMYYLGNNKYFLAGWDACADATLSYSDKQFEYNCDSTFQELIVRTWVAEDESGNKSICKDSIFTARVAIMDLQLPPSYNNIDSAALACNGDWIALPNGNPSPETTGSPFLGRCGDIIYQYTDTRFENCGNTFDVFRDWTIMDWCSQELVHWGQIIKVMDTIPPDMICEEEAVYISADFYNCYSASHQIELPIVTDDCGGTSLGVHVYRFGNLNEEVSLTFLNGNYYVSQLPLGVHSVVFDAMDDCGNQNSCSYDIIVTDNILPYAICDEHTQVSLGSNGIARLFAESLDDGSYDNCGIAFFEVRKMTDKCGIPDATSFGPYVDFCCEEVGDTIQVAMRITDTAGNTNQCMVEVLVEDKLFPAIICPPDITISCDYYYNPDKLEDYFGKVVFTENDRKNIVVDDYFNHGVVGKDGIAFDNCNVQIETTVEFDLNSCNVGTIYRTFTAVDDGGLKQPCLQRIFIEDPDPFDESDIVWPLDVEVTGCLQLDVDTVSTGSPIVDDDACSLVAVSYSDQHFSIVNDACEKVVRTWTVIDWCQFDHNTLEGQWTYKQIIKLNNTVAPVFTSDCEDRDVCVYGNCNGIVELEATALDDCTQDQDLNWVWRIDRDDDGSVEYFGLGNSLEKLLEEGIYRVEWTVEDKCGNESYCSYLIHVVDCKLPTPYCISSLTTVVMNSNGMITVTPEPFDIGSYDNCTAQEDLLLSWSSDVNDTLFTVDCEAMNGVPARTFFLELWVTDEAGNQDYCSVWLEVQDNFDYCGNNSGGGGLVLGGTVSLPDNGTRLKNATVNLNCNVTEFSATTKTNQNGAFTFDQVSPGYDYEVAMQSEDSECNKGVSTLDLVFIQRHILGLGLLDSPYKMLAADANNSNSVSAADILEIRKVILGIRPDFNKSNCWKFVPKSHVFSNSYMPWNYPASINYYGLESNQLTNEFYAIKTGDVNGSYSPATGDSEVESRNVNRLAIEDQLIQQGEQYTIPVFSADLESMAGMQFTIELSDQIEFIGMEPGVLDISETNYALQAFNGKTYISFSWNDMEDVQIPDETPLFYVNLKSGTESVLSEQVQMGDWITRSMVISNFEENQLKMQFRQSTQNEFASNLYQNEPNPFDNLTKIQYEIPAGQEITIRIFDSKGMLVKLYKNYETAGRHEIEISALDLETAGIYYYTLETVDFVDTKKMIYLK